jgi:hypothetical protein
MVSIALNLSRDLGLLGVLRERLAQLGIRAELREHLLSLVVFRDSRLPVCVFIGGNGRFYSWDGGRGREHVADVDRTAAQLAKLASSPVKTGPRQRHALPMKGSDHEDT